MQILVISDTHGAYQQMKNLIRSHESADLVIHCGDGEYDVERYQCEFPEDAQRIVMVRGNCDFSSSLPLMHVQEMPFGHKLMALHGHRYVHGNMRDNLTALAKEQGADILLFGHLHGRVDCFTEGVHLFNPGSVTQPRDGKPPSFGLIDIFESGVLFSHGDVPYQSYPMQQP